MNNSGCLRTKYMIKRMMFVPRAVKSKASPGSVSLQFGKSGPSNGVKTPYTSLNSPSDCRAVRSYLSSKTIRMIMLAAAFLASGAGCSQLFADPPKKTDEPWTAPGRAARKENPIITDAKALAQGKELFVAACLPCHGPTGKGDGPVAATLERDGKQIRPGNLSDSKLWQQSDGALFWKISEGKTPMPAFQEALTEEQRWQIITFVRTLSPKEENKNQQTKSGGK